MPEKIIIENRTDLPICVVLHMVEDVIRRGRISDNGKQYCYATAFLGGALILTTKNKSSDRFVACMRSEEKQNVKR